MRSRRGGLAWGWLVLAAVAALVPVALGAVTAGGCSDAPDPLGTACSVGPAVGEGGVIAAWILWALFAWWCLQRALRPARRARRVARVRRDTGVAADGSTPRVGAHTAVEVPLPDAGGVRLQYAPRRDGRPDGGEIVWAWVPFQEDPTRGKDRPLLIIGRHDAQHMLAMKLTSRSRDGSRDHLAIGSGDWDRAGRESWLDIDQVYRVHPAGIRREAAPLPPEAFARVAGVLARRYGWTAL